MGEELENQRRLEMESGDLLPGLQLSFTLRSGMDRRRYNAQRTNEVAAVFRTTADGEIPESYVTIRNKNTKILQKVSTMDPNVEPWIYPLFYPYGTQGRRLFQQWLVDNYVKMEKDRIDYCKTHQKELRSETYQGLRDYIQTMANNLNGRIGKMIVDKYISAEIPDPSDNRILHDIVMKHMIHGPCGDWCLVDGKCSKHYPKSYFEETKMDEDAYPYYCRQNNGKNFKRPGGYIVDNRYVVPYCPTLSIIFNCHINVEVVSSIKSVKYLYKYIYKRHDVAAITIEPITENVIIDHDEIHNYIKTRYVGPVETCWRILGLIEDDDEWNRAMNEAVGWMMPRQLRKLFVRILLHCQPLHPEELWDNFKTALSEDYVRHFGMLQGQKKAYIQINNMLCTEGKSLADFPQMEQLLETELLNEENDYVIFEQAMEIAKIRKKHVCAMAFTGIAATLLPAGKTVHKTFGLPVPLFADLTSAIKIQSKEAQYLKNTDIFIWDEAPMSPRYALEIMDRTLRDIMNNNLPFGGKIVLLGGDFRQLLPIKIWEMAY
ncbi:uncharacterized protein [Linepithema humile]|uniref:uncharacterized protein n=1 Tax=Linepithema humile TaxID=83485 RepID=UPI00351E9F7B